MARVCAKLLNLVWLARSLRKRSLVMKGFRRLIPAPDFVMLTSAWKLLQKVSSRIFDEGKTYYLSVFAGGCDHFQGKSVL